MYRNLFSPIRINSLEIKNRIAYPALGLLYSHDRKLNDRYVEFYRERARGGVGLLTVGPVGVDFIGSGVLVLGIDTDEAVPDFSALTRIIKDEGARAWIQLFHAGGYSHPILIDGQQPIAPSAVYSRYSRTTPKEMTPEDIEMVQQSFAASAVRAKEAGFDGIEIIASAGYLLSQFLSPVKNLRTDAYGGSFENRLRFPVELIGRVRRAVGPDFPLTIRMAGNDFVPGSCTDDEMPDIARAYERAGIDAVNVTGGWHETRVPQLPMDVPRSAFAFLAHNIKKAVTVPVMASNRIADPDTAESIIKNGYADMVNLGRVLIADPQWPNKAFEGRTDEIRPCTACSQGCTDQVFQGRPVFCAGNPEAGYEAERKIVRTDFPRQVMVVGAGPAGLEAAVTAAASGHQVEIYEKDRDIGGQLWMAGAPPHKAELLELIRYYRAMIRRHGIPLYLNTAVDARFIQERRPDHVIVAEGAEAVVPGIEGKNAPNVLTAWDVLKNNPPLGQAVAVVGGGAVGLETAFFAAAKGTITPEILYFLFAYEAESVARLRELMFRGTSRVTVFEMLPKAGADLGKSTKWVLLDNLDRYGVTVHTNTKVISVADGNVRFEKDGRVEKQPFDHVILSAGAKPVSRLAGELKDSGVAFQVIGDGLQPGRIQDAVHQGYLAAGKIGGK
ncbi:MAG: FAD-dependent oxidoreductase [Thermodesulfobacteriota bacterium]